MSIYQARFMRYLHDRGLIDAADRKVWAFHGDGEMDEPESLGAISLAGREKLDNLIWVDQLQPAAARRPGARQRQDHSRTGARLQGRRLERHQGHLGQRLGSRCSQRRYQRTARAGDERVRRRRLSNVQIAKRQVRARRVFRTLSGNRGARRRLERRRNLGACSAAATIRSKSMPHTKPRSNTADSRPSSSPRRSKATAWAKPGEAHNIAHQAKKMEVEAMRAFRDRFAFRSAMTRSRRFRSIKPPDDSRRDALPARAR